ncbi:tetratricopeptide repeat domain-containing protein [Cordyceps fumosorosea ARSEF 2679]|uniref:Tetratricopeptide repeat domain-containing protein n=1 Tax=Cordyceps fumosorosea (strain ARSEF 2679) TaxID=1081104 RepID=A0A167N5D7_CORFA|nr:tetratricopeptide repeat domain-containing protein [Cordyceps fumosorosea ARSEF 2679]OAA55147.1 tetratricopeptide repeat domain-containing protein [Cordyceps fumosorosea ARSEF 2679]
MSELPSGFQEEAVSPGPVDHVDRNPASLGKPGKDLSTDKAIPKPPNKKKISEIASQVLQIILFFDHDHPIDDLFLSDVCSKSLSKRAAPFQKHHYKKACSELLEQGLIEERLKQNQSDEYEILLNASSRYPALGTMSQDLEYKIYTEIIRALSAHWPLDCPKPNDSELPLLGPSFEDLRRDWEQECAEIYPHICSLMLRYPRKCMPPLSDAVKLLFAKLLMKVVWFQKESGGESTEKLDSLCKLAHKIYEQSGDEGSRAALAEVYSCRGAIAVDSGNFHASAYYKTISLNILVHLYRRHKDESEMERLALAYAERGIAHAQDKELSEATGLLFYARSLRQQAQRGKYIPRPSDAILGFVMTAQGENELAATLLTVGVKRLKEQRFTAGGFGFYWCEVSARLALFLYALGNLRDKQAEMARNLKEKQNKQAESLQCFRDSSAIFNQLHQLRKKPNPYMARAAYKVAEQILKILNAHDADHDNDEEDSDLVFEATQSLHVAIDAWRADLDVYRPETARGKFLRALLLKKEFAIEDARNERNQAKAQRYQQEMSEIETAAAEPQTAPPESQTATPRSYLGIVDGSDLRDAQRLRKELTWGDEREASSLTMEDFDKLVDFWSR